MAMSTHTASFPGMKAGLQWSCVLHPFQPPQQPPGTAQQHFHQRNRGGCHQHRASTDCRCVFTCAGMKGSSQEPGVTQQHPRHTQTQCEGQFQEVLGQHFRPVQVLRVQVTQQHLKPAPTRHSTPEGLFLPHEAGNKGVAQCTNTVLELLEGSFLCPGDPTAPQSRVKAAQHSW